MPAAAPIMKWDPVTSSGNPSSRARPSGPMASGTTSPIVMLFESIRDETILTQEREEPADSATSTGNETADVPFPVCGPELWAPGHGPRTADLHRQWRRAGIGAQHHLRIEHGDECVDVAGPGRGEERVDEAALLGGIGCARRGHLALAHPAPAAAGELAGRGRRAVEDRRDLVERKPEGVVQDEGDPLGRREAFENDQHRQADGIGELRFVLGPDRDDRVGYVHPVERILAPCAARPEDVEADPGQHGREPSADVLDVARVGTGQADPCVLDRVVGLW